MYVYMFTAYLCGSDMSACVCLCVCVSVCVRVCVVFVCVCVRERKKFSLSGGAVGMENFFGKIKHQFLH